MTSIYPAASARTYWNIVPGVSNSVVYPPVLIGSLLWPMCDAAQLVTDLSDEWLAREPLQWVAKGVSVVNGCRAHAKIIYTVVQLLTYRILFKMHILKIYVSWFKCLLAFCPYGTMGQHCFRLVACSTPSHYPHICWPFSMTHMASQGCHEI